MNIPSLGLSLGVSRMNIPSDFLDRMAPRMERAYGAMDELEAGSIANPDEGRRVGHYWLRDPDRSPEGSIARAIRGVVGRIRAFAADVHAGRIGPAASERFTDVLLIGIGGSALGPQFVADALGDPDSDRMGMHFLDNTDPDGIDRVLRRLGDRLAGTLAVVVSKSGGTAETRNGMLLARAAYEAAGLDFPGRAAAVTGPGSKLDQLAEREGWLLRLPMWDWVGGRTSETGPVGLLPAALRGIDIDALLAGAAACDAATRRHDTPGNPAALMALAWHHATGGAGEKDMVVLPYKDRLLLFSRYLQQLVMESLGKGEDRDGNRVEQGIAVYGNKGSTDQHAYVQQLREGVNNFFVVFIRVLEDEAKVAPAPAGNTEARGGVAADHEIEPGVTAGDYLHGFWLGTREALAEKGRLSMTLTVRRIDAFQIGVLIALFERAVGFYASLVNVNAYHQPGVEAGKKAAAAVLETQRKTLEHLRVADGPADAGRIAEAIGEPGRVETIRHILEHLAANERVIAREGGYEAPAGPR